MNIKNGDSVEWMRWGRRKDDTDPLAQCGTVIDADPLATMISVVVGLKPGEDGWTGEPFFQRLPASVLRVKPPPNVARFLQTLPKTL